MVGMANNPPFKGMVEVSMQIFMRLRAPLCLGVLFLLTGCAGVTVTPLDATGKKAPGQEAGLRYYMPRPYLLVVQLPPTATKTDSSSGGDGQVEADAVPPGGNSSTKPQKDSPTTNTDTAASSPGSSPISDTSFMAATPQYQVKLIYLPDLEHPMAMTSSTGLFGTSTMTPTLQDGWMLTSLNANADSKMAETLTALASIAGSVAGGGTGAAAKAAKSTATSTQSLLAQFGPQATPVNPVLRPGLYRFEYNKKGVMTGLKAVAFFDADTGIVAPSK
jgi:hypothetical protein